MYTRRRNINYYLINFFLLGLLCCCSGTNPEEEYTEQTVDRLYNLAVNALESSRYSQAAKHFEEVERQHPYSAWAIKAQLMAGYAHYQGNDYDDAILGLDRFIRLHPGNEDIAYAYYLKALCYYEQISDVSRDQNKTEKALQALTNVFRRYPDTKYARDAKLKIDLAQDHLAGKQMEIGRFYLNKKQYLAAINRFRRVVDHYQTTTHIPEALHRLVEAYTALGLMSEARRIASVLGYNYPGSNWYLDSYALAAGSDLREIRKKKGFFARSMDWLF